MHSHSINMQSTGAIPKRKPIVNLASNVESITSRTAAAGNAASPIPRPTLPVRSTINRNCWFHRQFGATSVRCIPPCNFVGHPAPPLPQQVLPNPAQANATGPQAKETPVVSQVSAAIVRVPLERTARIPKKSSSSSSSSSDSEPRNQKKKQPTNWVKMAQKDLSLSDSSSDAESNVEPTCKNKKA